MTQYLTRLTRNEQRIGDPSRVARRDISGDPQSIRRFRTDAESNCADDRSIIERCFCARDQTRNDFAGFAGSRGFCTDSASVGHFAGKFRLPAAGEFHAAGNTNQIVLGQVRINNVVDRTPET